MTCEGCGQGVDNSAEKWYGRWTLCVSCKARSVVHGWLPTDATTSERHALTDDVERLRKEF